MQNNFDPAKFAMVILDKENRVFGFVGPMCNDSKITNRVTRLNRLGRRLAILGPVDESISSEQYQEQIARETGYRFSADLMLENVTTPGAP